ncbi:MAG: universal stress protein [Alphaproteobacteria bacterium]|nr:universal stress protein [Alphaproteobacteria bacterium]
MQRFKNILVLYDRTLADGAVLDRAAELAKENSARLTVVEAIEGLPAEVIELVGSSAGGLLDRQERFVQNREAQLEKLVAPLLEDGIDAKAAVLRGKPFLQVIRAVLQDNHDLVLTTADPRGGLRATAFGSTPMRLMRKCPCPVWVMKPGVGREFRRILAAVDPAVTADPSDSLNPKIMQLASSLARMERCELEILNVWDFVGSDIDTIHSELSPDIKEKLVERNEAVHRKALDRLIADTDLEGVPYQVELARGVPSIVILETVEKKQIDLIVMGTVSRTGIAGFIIGNTAEEVLGEVDCSVLTVKPDGFVTPVTLEA